MGTVTMGSTPETLALTLTEGADFVSRARLQGDAPWPTGSTLALVFPDGTRWEAVDEDTTWRAWNVDKAEVAAMLAKRRATSGTFVVRLVYTEGGYDAVWAAGALR